MTLEMPNASLVLPVLGIPARAATTIRLSDQRSSTLQTRLEADGTPEAHLKPCDVSWPPAFNVIGPMKADPGGCGVGGVAVPIRHPECRP